MQRHIESDTSTMYAKTIEKVMKAMHGSMKQSGYSDETIKKIQTIWKENINKAPRSKFAYISPFKLPPPVRIAVEVKKEEPPPVPQPKIETPPEVHSSDSDDLYEEEEADPGLAEFQELKRIKLEEAERNKEVQAEEEKSESMDEHQASDDETKLDCPEATGIIHCLHEAVKRKGNCWTINIKACVYQEAGRGEVFFRTAQSKFNFMDNK